MREKPRVLTLPPGVPFLPELVDALLGDRLGVGHVAADDPLALSDATIYLPTRRAARELRSAFVDRLGGVSAILPRIVPLGEFEDDAWLYGDGDPAALDMAPPVEALERVLALAPLVQAWKRRLPAHLAALYGEDVVVPASLADALWLARDLAGLMDEIETEGVGWERLADLVPEELANWWQVTLEFLDIVRTHWPGHLAATGKSNPAAHRNALLRAEAERIGTRPPAGPVIAAGSTGSIPATAELLKAISLSPRGAVVLPGLDLVLDAAAWHRIGSPDAEPSAFGHPQSSLRKLLSRLGIDRSDVEELAAPAPGIAARNRLVGEALRPAETTERWAGERAGIETALAEGALDRVSLVEAANEREEALAIAVALRLAIETDGAHAALVTGDRDLARRVAVELRRFGITADDSAGTRLAVAPPGALLGLMVRAVLAPGDPVTLLALLKHPLVHLGLPRAAMRRAAETIELVALRGGVGRPDIAALPALFEDRFARLSTDRRKPFWFARMREPRLAEARKALAALATALAPLTALREARDATLADYLHATVLVAEALCRGEDGAVDALYDGDAGAALAQFLRRLVETRPALALSAPEWPDVLDALIASESVRPTPAGDPRVSIWGTLEARLQSVKTVVLGGLNEGNWPRRAEPDRFMSRMMKAGMDLEPPERMIGLAAHDFAMAMGHANVVVTRSARAGEAPAVASRWVQRLLTCAGAAAGEAMRERGRRLIGWARALDAKPEVPLAARPSPKPPVAARPTRFSVTEIETLRRDPYAIYARHVLGLDALEPLLRDPGAAERGNLFHDILHAFNEAEVDPADASALGALIETGRRVFDAADLPPDVDAVWWPRFERQAAAIIEWERGRGAIEHRHAELSAGETPIGVTGALLRGRADRIDMRTGGSAEIIDFKTGSSPSKRQAFTLLSPQLALEGALLMKGAFAAVGPAAPAALAYVRLKANGTVAEESILKHDGEEKTADELSLEAWQRLEKLIAHYQEAEAGYLSRALPFRESEVSGTYDHLARVLEWSAGTDEAEEGSE